MPVASKLKYRENVPFSGSYFSYGPRAGTVHDTVRLVEPPHAAASVPSVSPIREAVAGIPLKFGAALAAIDIVAVSLAMILASFTTVMAERFLLHVSPYTNMATLAAERRNIDMVLGLAALAMFWSKGLYARRTPWWSQVQYIGKVLLLVCLIDGFLSFALKLYESRLLIASTWAFAFGGIVPFRWLACRLAAKTGWWKIPTVIIADNATAADLAFAFSADPCAGYDIRTIFLRDPDAGDFDIGNLPRECRHVRVRDGLADYESWIRRNPGCFYVIALDSFRGETRDRLLSLLDEAGTAYAIVPAIARVGLYEMEPRYFFGHDVMLLQPRAASRFSSAKAIKRGMDIGVAGLALLALAPLFGMVALMLKIEGQGGTVFYGGERIGRQGRRFNCWKFRSMEPESDYLLHAYLNTHPAARADWEKFRKLPNDPRVTTRTARFIRAASIDELPQLWNVLTGDMSLVGPRPILEDEVGYFGDALRDYLSVRPGLTGLWQVSGRNATSFLRRVHWDSWYVRNWSLWGDIVILIKTPLVLLSRKGVL